MSAPPQSLGIIAGNGRYPVLLAEAARARGVKRLAVVGFAGETATEVEKLADHYIQLRVGQLGALCNYFREQNISQAIMAGQIRPGNLFDLRPDLKAVLLLAKLKERNAESIFGAIADELKKAGVELLPATTFLEDSLARPGHIAGPKLTRRQEADVAFGFRVAKEISRMDIGQSVVVKKGTVVAVEAFEGTDAAMERGGRLGKGDAVLVKVSKPGQDFRFDVPVIGPRTLESARASSVRVVACEALRTLLLDRPLVLEQAGRWGISLFAADESILNIMTKIRVGVVGVGHIGREHARIYSQLPGVQFVGLCDIDGQVAQKAAQRHGVKAYGTAEALAQEVDAATIATPTNTHYEIAKLFFGQGKHLLVEKPITDNTSQAKELVELAQAKNLVFQVGHIERFNPALHALEEKLTRPRFIEAHRLSTYPGRSTDIGVVLDLMIHDIDVVLHLVRSPIVSVDSVGTAVLSKGEDIANARIRFENGCVANLTTSRISFEKMRKIRVFQNDAYLSLDYFDQSGVIYRKIDAQIVKENIKVEKDEPLKLELSAFVECVRQRQSPRVGGRSGGGRSRYRHAGVGTDSRSKTPDL